MHDIKIIQDILNTENLNYFQYTSPVGEIYIFASNEFVNSLMFLKDRQIISKITSNIQKLRNVEIEKMLSYMELYFNHEWNDLRKFNILLNSDNSNINKKLLNPGYICNINLDLSSYTEKEIELYRNLLKIDSGKTISYKNLGERSGVKDAARFVGNTMVKNRFPVIIPCHRVIKSTGEMGNYSGGIDKKRFLLKMEKKQD